MRTDRLNKMVNQIPAEIRQTLALTLGQSGIPIEAAAIRLAPRHAAASVHLPPEADAGRLDPKTFPPLYGAPLASRLRRANGWLLLEWSDSFYDALVRTALERFPPATNDGGEHALHRMLLLSRHGGDGCPRVPSMQRALLLACLAGERPASYRAASRALETMFHPVPARERPALLRTCGAFGDAAARLLALARKEPTACKSPGTDTRAFS